MNLIEFKCAVGEECFTVGGIIGRKEKRVFLQGFLKEVYTEPQEREN